MDLKFETGNITVKYKVRDAKQDRQHLVVVFAGVTTGEHDFYGFDGNALDHVKGTILWIKDSFENNNSYYLCTHLEFSIERAVSLLIDTTLANLGLGPENCTLMGGSKGGSAALHIGLKNNYSNIIASVPQTRLGTYVREKMPATYNYMADVDLQESENLLNDYIPNLIANPASHHKNIYIISSKADSEYFTHIEPLLIDLKKFTNFNLLITDSTLVTSHPEVTPYNIPLMLSMLYALCDGIAPSFGFALNGNGFSDRLVAGSFFENQRHNNQNVAGFHWTQLRGESFNFRAYVASIGNPTTTPPKIRPRLIVHSGRREIYSFNLDIVEDKSLNSKLYKKHFCDYRWSGVKTLEDRGILLNSIPIGKYELSIQSEDVTGIQFIPLISTTFHKSTIVVEGNVLYFETTPQGSWITKISVNAPRTPIIEFAYSSLKFVDTKLLIMGSFIVDGEPMRHWNDGLFSLTLCSEGKNVSHALASTRISIPSQSTRVNDISGHAWSGFSTPGHKGLDLALLDNGEYECTVAFISDQRIYIGSDSFNVSVTDKSFKILAQGSSFAPG